MKRKYFIIVLGLLLLIILSGAILFNVVKNDRIIYEHEKHYREYKEQNGEDFGDILTETKDKTVRLTGNGNYDVSYLFESLNPFDSLTVRLDSTVDDTYTNLFLDNPFSLYDEKGELLADIYVGPSGRGYYDPFDKEWESCVWVSDVDGDSLTLKLLAVERFFMGYEFFPNVFVESDFDRLKEITLFDLSEGNSLNWEDYFETYHFPVGNTEMLHAYGLDTAASESAVSEGICVSRRFSYGRTYGRFDDALQDYGFTNEDKRRLESKVVKEGYEAYMAMITFTVDVSGEYPTFALEWEMISPKKHRVSDVRFGGLTCDKWNEFLKETFYNVDTESLQLTYSDCRTYLDEDFAVINGKVVSIKNSGSEVSDRISEISNASYIDASRFVFCEDGTVVDMFEASAEDISGNLISELNSAFGIRQIVTQLISYDIFTKNNEIFMLDYPEAFRYNEPKQGIKRTVSEQSESVVWVTLNGNGTVSCEIYKDNVWQAYEPYSKTLEWSDIVDVCVGDSFVIGLTSDGKVVSDGIEFSAENIVRIDILEIVGNNIPLALTSDGFFTAPLSLSFETVKEAQTFTDIVDFITVDSADNYNIILAKKSDGSLVATTNNIYNPEYVTMP